MKIQLSLKISELSKYVEIAARAQRWLLATVGAGRCRIILLVD